MSLKSLVAIFQTLELLQPHWPHRPLQPHWPLLPQKPYFTKKLSDPDGWIIPGIKMTNTGPCLWNGLSKIQFFTDIWYFFCRMLLRSADVIFFKDGCGALKFLISAFQNHLQKKFNLHIFISQSQSISVISIWDTLYIVSVVLLSRFIKCGVLLPWNSNELLTELLTNDLFLAPIVCKISVIHNASHNYFRIAFKKSCVMIFSKLSLTKVV